MGLLESLQNRAATPLRAAVEPPPATPVTARAVQSQGFSGASAFDGVRLPPIDLDLPPLDGGYTPPTEDDHAVPADEAQRSVFERLVQEAAVRRSIEEGTPVQFTNAAGETEELTFTRDGDDYIVTDSHGNSFRVSPQEGLTEEELLQGVAAFADHWSQYPEHLRGAVDRIELFPGERRATFHPDGDFMQMGMDDLDEMTFDHEMGHAIAHQAGAQGDSPLEQLAERIAGNESLPEGWEEARAAAGAAPSEYANTNSAEDFGEAWLAYVEARELGPEAVEALREKYPHRVAIMEEIWNGTYEG